MLEDKDKDSVEDADDISNESYLGGSVKS